MRELTGLGLAVACLAPMSAIDLAFVPSIAWAQAAQTAQGHVDVNGSVATACYGGTLTGGDTTFALGLLTDTSTGLLRKDLSAPDKVLTGAYCNLRSTLAIAATPMTAQNATATPPSGFTRSVDYTATASGWTVTPASVNTALAVNTGATQTRDSAFAGTITVSIGQFAATGGNTQVLVSDTAYRGTVTLTLSAGV
ncbi:MAG: hypothetical protein KGJ57_22730 [Sphingomonadales bacterium]|nr:hypothetical protein [Sphingomonadales bacterium]MDE2172201.1 hypothetical protein [Sphingomonadales bacterium]